MLNLMQAKEMEQRVSDAIAAALKVEVEIIDANLVRVAGTGQVRAMWATDCSGGWLTNMFCRQASMCSSMSRVSIPSAYHARFRASVFTGPILSIPS